MFKKHMTALTKGGAKHNHVNKASQQAAMPDRGQVSQLARSPMSSINDYAKATPMAQPMPSPVTDSTEGGF